MVLTDVPLMTGSLVKHLTPELKVTPHARWMAWLKFLAGCHGCTCESEPPLKPAEPVSVRGSLSITTHWPLSTFQLNLKLAFTHKINVIMTYVQY